MSRGRRSTKPWVALAAALAGLVGAAQISEADWMRLGRAVWQVVASYQQEEEAPRRRAPRAGSDLPTAPFSGQARVLDGDTLDINGVRVRMQGIDALESDQQCNRPGGRYACGREAREQLATLIGGRDVTCTPDGTETYGRSVALCTVSQGGRPADLNAAMVRSGYAFDCTRFSKGRYAEEEAEAKAEKAGAWAGRFTFPWSHRDRAGACGR